MSMCDELSISSVPLLSAYTGAAGSTELNILKPLFFYYYYVTYSFSTDSFVIYY